MYKSKTARFALSEHYFRPHCMQIPQSVADICGICTPQQMRRAYSFDRECTGKGKKIAVISALDNVGAIESMRVFCDKFSLTMPQMTLYYPYGRAQSTSRQWLVESSLDTQWAHVFAPEAEIVLVFSPDASVSGLLVCAQYAAKELSAHVVCMCFGTEESGKDAALSEFFLQSDSVFAASSGDVGGVVSFPSSNPYCISVGGTSLVPDKTGGKRLFETAWRNSGGGESEIFEMKPWQRRFSDIYGMSRGRRATPDVAMAAEAAEGVPVYISELSGWTAVGGTSLSAACFSGICACIMEKYSEIRNSGHMLSFLYERAGGTEYKEPQYSFNDITVGRSGKYYAKRGWDFASGLGSPVVIDLLRGKYNV